LRGDSGIVVTDPFPESIGLSIGKPEARIVTVSHSHPNHSNTKAVTGNVEVVSGAGEYEISTVYVRGVATLRARSDPPEKKNVAYLVDMDGISLVHLGDISMPLSSGQLEELEPVDVLCVPAGGTCTLPPPQIAELVHKINPKIVIPMHYKVPGLKVDLLPLDGLLKELDVKEITPQNRLNVTRSNLPQQLQVVVMGTTGAR
jgi:L-ascorbate metabolism protein UlaG (beta-lactamase superfamily)